MKSPDSTPSHVASVNKPVVEPITRRFLDSLKSSGGPPLETLPPTEARAVLTAAQCSVKPNLAPADVSTKSITIEKQSVELTIVRPTGLQDTPPVFMFFHGGGWVLGDYPTHERLIRDLVAESKAVAVYVDYDRSPEAQYPTAIQQAFAATQWVATHGREINVDGSRLAVVGNSVGGNMATAVALRASSEGGVKLRSQVLLWPVTDARFDTPSYEAFQENHFLTRNMMKWFWDSYTKDPEKRAEIYASPLRATLDQLKGLPPTLIQTAELDVLRDEGEAYARKLALAGVDVTSIRVNQMIHDYGLLNPLAHVPAVQTALRQAGAELKLRLA